MVDEDYLDRANVDVMKGEVKSIDLVERKVYVKGHRDPIKFDKVMVAWGAQKRRLDKEYSNVFYLEDRHSHARAHNEILKAKQIVVMGGTFEAYQTVTAIRDYLDSIGFNDTSIALIDSNKSEVA
jgi:thioredoxin reductase